MATGWPRGLVHAAVGTGHLAAQLLNLWQPTGWPRDLAMRLPTAELTGKIVN